MAHEGPCPASEHVAHQGPCPASERVAHKVRALRVSVWHTVSMPCECVAHRGPCPASVSHTEVCALRVSVWHTEEHQPWHGYQGWNLGPRLCLALPELRPSCRPEGRLPGLSHRFPASGEKSKNLVSENYIQAEAGAPQAQGGLSNFARPQGTWRVPVSGVVARRERTPGFDSWYQQKRFFLKV